MDPNSICVKDKELLRSILNVISVLPLPDILGAQYDTERGFSLPDEILSVVNNFNNLNFFKAITNQQLASILKLVSTTDI